VDWSKALEAVQGDGDMLRELSEAFLIEYPEVLGQIREAIAGQDGPQLQLAAHRLKGSLRLFAAQSAQDLCWELETMAKRSDVGAAGEAFAALEDELDQLVGDLRNFIGQGGPKMNY
jgi:HPt (histidine-containing phosphotransfer) domain-containing protein